MCDLACEMLHSSKLYETIVSEHPRKLRINKINLYYGTIR